MDSKKIYYQYGNFRKKIGLKLNVEMLLLADEMFKKRGSTIHLTMGNPIDPTCFNKTKSNLNSNFSSKKFLH